MYILYILIFLSFILTTEQRTYHCSPLVDSAPSISRSEVALPDEKRSYGLNQHFYGKIQYTYGHFQ